MSAHGIRGHQDIDLLVTPDLYDELKQRGWQVKQITADFAVVVCDIFEASPKMMTLPNYKPDIEKLIKTADIINDVAFVKLTDVIDFKRAMGREKDTNDIALIKKYLKL